MTLTLGIAEMVFKLKLIHCYIFKNSYIIIFLSFRDTLGHFDRIIGTLLCYHGNRLMMICNAILCLNTDESLYPHVNTQIQCSDGIFKVLEHLKP